VGAAEVRADHVPAAVGGQAGERGVAGFTGATTGASQDQARNEQPADDEPAAGEPVQGAIQGRHHQWGQLSEYGCGRHPLRRPADKPVDVEQCHVRRLRDTARDVGERLLSVRVGRHRYGNELRGEIVIELLAGLILNGPILSGPGVGCTYEHPAPTAINQVCTGYGFPGTSCKVNTISCSPVPGTPGTWNPDGYTPKVG